MKCNLFYIYHRELICKCTQERVSCEGIIENCENKNGRRCYEEDITEDKNK